MQVYFNYFDNLVCFNKITVLIGKGGPSFRPRQIHSSFQAGIYKTTHKKLEQKSSSFPEWIFSFPLAPFQHSTILKRAGMTTSEWLPIHICGNDMSLKHERESMKKRKVKYTNEPIGHPRVIKDFLPPPEQLAFREDHVKITLALSKSSVEFFKKHAERMGTQYQKMIRRLLDAYALQYR